MLAATSFDTPASTLFRYDPARDPEALLSPEQAGAMLSLTPRKLAADRTAGTGIPYIRIAANRVRYRRRDLIAWIAEMERTQNGAASGKGG